MLVVKEDLIDFLGSSYDPADETTIDTIHNSVEKWANSYCRRTFESTSYSLEKYDGNGSKNLFLNNYPIITLDRLAVGQRDVIRVKNTNTSTTASISVTSTGIRLVKDGVVNSTVTFVTYPTLSTLTAAITAIAGWEATVQSSLYNSYLSTELMTVFGLNAIEQNWVYLYIAEDAEYDFKVDPTRGQIRRSTPFPFGFQNIFVTYSAGFATIPEDLKVAVKISVKTLLKKFKEDTWNLSAYRIGDISYDFLRSSAQQFDKEDVKNVLQFIPSEVRSIFEMYRRRLV